MKKFLINWIIPEPWHWLIATAIGVIILLYQLDHSRTVALADSYSYWGYYTTINPHEDLLTQDPRRPTTQSART